jgi:hypothetical protein
MVTAAREARNSSDNKPEISYINLGSSLRKLQGVCRRLRAESLDRSMRLNRLRGIEPSPLSAAMFNSGESGTKKILQGMETWI